MARVIMRLSKDELIMLSRLLDTALELPAEAREPWLERLAEPFSALRPRLRELLSQQASAETDDFLDTLPKFTVASGETDQAAHAASVREGQIVGVYRLVREIGHGGMSTVWLATRTDGLIKRPVALKLPHQHLHLHAQFADRFARERDILAALTHPNIARLYDAGISPEGQPYLAVEYVEGLSLIDYCDSHRLTIGDRVAVFLQVLAAVQYAHAHLVIHRDLKPSNILVMATGHVQLLDFGIAKLLTDGEAKETALTQIGGRALTPDYASPEQIVGQPLSIASDVYSLGVVLFELLSGSRPYQLKRNSRGALEQAILEADPRNPSESLAVSHAAACAVSDRSLARTLKGDLDTIVLKALQKDPHARYSTADAFAGDIHRYQRGEPLLAKPGGLWYRGGKFLRRYRVMTAAGAAIFVALAAGLGIALWQAQVADEQRVIADQEASHAKAEAAKATTEAKKAAAIKDFLLGIFGANDPKSPVARKPSDLTAREILDEGQRRIAGSLYEQPEIKHEILLALGGLYDEIGLPDKAISLCRDAASIAEQRMADRAEAMADALRCIALAQEQGDRKAAEVTIAKAEGMLASVGDRSSLLYAQVQTIKASLLRQYGSQRGNELIGILKNVIPLWRQRYPSDAGHMVAWAYLANVYWDLGDRTEAVGAADQAIAAARAGSGGQLGLADAHFTRAQYENKLGDYASAESDYRDASAIYGNMLGNNRPRTLRNNCLLGHVLHAQGKREAGIGLLLQSTAAMERALPSSDALTICLEQLGYAYIEQGRADKAEKLFVKAGAIFERLGDKLFQTNAQLGIAQALEFRGRYGEARRLAQDVIAIRKENQSQTASLRAAYLRLAQIELHDNRLDAAEATLEYVLSTDHSTGGPSPLPLDIATAKSMRAELARLRGDNTGAIVRSEEALEFVRSQRVPMAALVEAPTLGIQGSAMCGTGQVKRGLESLSHSLDIFESHHQPSSPYLADAQAAYGMCLLRMGRPDDAHARLLLAKTILAANTELGEHFRKPVRELDVGLQQHDGL
jgi:serine/threonine protein kinase